MSDKLQEIKRWVQGAVEGGFTPVTCPTSELVYLIEQLEQAQAENEQLSKQLEECMGSHERLEAACHRLKEDKRKLHAAYDENYAKAAHRAGVIKELQAANQKLVEGLAWYAACEHYEANVTNQWGPEIAVLDDGGQRAYDILKEVKGNVGDS